MYLHEKRLKLGVLLLTVLLSACAVGPDYKRPPVQVPVKFKEAPKGWKIAKPNDNFNRGQWWKIFHDPALNKLEAELIISNQNIALAAAQYQQARALVSEARAAYFPTLAAAANLQRQKTASISASNSSSAVANSQGVNTTTGTGTQSTFTSAGFHSSSNRGPFDAESLLLNASWEPDIWGSVRRNVEASVANAQASAAQLQLARLSAQASLAQYYFEVRGLDRDQVIFDNTVANYKKTLQYTLNQYKAGVVARSDNIQARAQLEGAQAQAINNQILRSQYEHAIAVLIGIPASNFTMPPHALTANPPHIPLEVPSSLLERRPDIAQAERLMAQANAQIGVAIATYFPTLTLSGAGSALGTGSIANWIGYPALGWSLGAQLADTIFDGGLRSATVLAARDNYHATIASYRQTVLAAFQDVEDNLSSLQILKAEEIVLNKAAKDATTATQLILNQYKAGIIPFATVITTQNAQLTAEKSAADVKYLEMTAAVGLIKALGGGWCACGLTSTTQYCG